jgi:O-antigen/teichoic acid export membrane protein
MWNLAGQGIPLIVAVIAIPPLIRTLGTEKFGMLSLAWVLVGYFSIFDLGIGRALTQIVAQRVYAMANLELTGRLIWTSLVLLLGIGIAASALLIAATPWLLGHVLKTPHSLIVEATGAFYAVAVAVPFVVTATGLRGVLEARQAFALSNAIRLPLGTLTYLAPILALPFTHRLDVICMTLLASRVLALAAFLVASFRVLPTVMSRPAIAWSGMKSLLSFSGWMAITNVVGPLMMNLDRFVIASAISIAAVAYYSTPFDVVTRLFIIPAAITGVMFPAFAATYGVNRDSARRLFLRGNKYLAMVMFPIALGFVTLAEPGLYLWLGQGFASRSTVVLQWLAVGVLVNSVGQLSFVLIQGAGRPYLTGLLTLIELPLYLVMLMILVGRAGIEGAAVAWTLRITIDAIVLLVMALNTLDIRITRLPAHIALVGLAAALLVIGSLSMPILGKIAFLAVTGIAMALVGWFMLLTREERIGGRRTILSLARRS